MDTIPDDIMWTYMVKKFQLHQLVFVCKAYHNLFLNHIKNNHLLMKRYQAIRESYEQYQTTQQMVVRFDRMYYSISDERQQLVIHAKVFYDQLIDPEDIKVTLIFTTNAWKHTSNITIAPQITYIGLAYGLSDVYFTIYPGPSNGVYNSNHLPYLYKTWFALKASYKGTDVYDNNGDWNHATLKQYNWIPNVIIPMCDHDVTQMCPKCTQASVIEWCLTEPVSCQYDL